MVKEEVKKFLVEGRNHNLSVDELRKRLLASGFQPHDVDEAIWELDQAASHEGGALNSDIEVTSAGKISISKSKIEPSTSKVEVTDADKIVSEEGGELGFFAKVALSVTKPLSLFERTRSERLYPVLLHYFQMMILPYIILIILGASISVEIVTEFTSLLVRGSIGLSNISLLEIGGGGAALLISIILLVLLFLVGPLILLISASILHGTSKLYGGKGTYDGAFRVIVYSLTLLIYFFWLPLIPTGGIYLLGLITLWVLILIGGGVSVIARMSRLRASIVVFTILTILAGIAWSIAAMLA